MRSGGFARGAKGAEARGAQRPAGAPSQCAGAASSPAARPPAAAPPPARRAAAPPRAAPAAPAAPAAAAPAAALASPVPGAERPLRVIIAGAGIGGLVAAVGLLKRGFEVRVLERDLTAIRGEGQYRGPIQLQSNALAALEALDARVAERVMAAGCITGDRINGLCDGVTGAWYCKFDTFHPAVDRGLPVTRVVSRFALQEILADAARALGGPGVIENDVHVLDYEHGVDAATGAPTATAVLEDGRRLEADLLVAADGIRSKLRTRMVGASEPAYSAYTCYTGIADFTPPDIDLVGYRVFLGNRQYFVSSDVGGGRMQWYAFHCEPSGGTDAEGQRKARLLEIFGGWTDMVTDLIRATPEADVLRRDIFDRPPVGRWVDGRVALLGDSAHAMQPNLGQGGGMAIEDAFQLVEDLGAEDAAAAAEARPRRVDSVLSGYFRKRVLRAAAIHGMAGSAAFMASTYKAYLGEGLGPLEAMTALRIPHPGRVGGQLVMALAMPGVLSWVLGGYGGALAKSGRPGACRLEDAPAGFAEPEYARLISDDDAILRAARAEWVLQPAAAAAALGPDDDPYTACVPVPPAAGLDLGAAPGAGGLAVDAPGVAPRHARVERRGEDYFLVDAAAADAAGGAAAATLLNGRRLAPGEAARLRPGDEFALGAGGAGGKPAAGAAFRVKMRHLSLAAGNDGAPYDRRRGLAPPAAAAH